MTLVTYVHLEKSSRGRRVLAVGKVVGEKMILPDLQESQKRVIILHTIRSTALSQTPGKRQEHNTLRMN